MYNLSYGILSFLANTSVVLPFYLILKEYNSTPSKLLLTTLLVIYGIRSTAVWFLPKRVGQLKFLNLKTSVFTGFIGFLLIAINIQNSIIMIIAAILLGYTSANIWPYFLSYRTENRFKPVNTKITSLIFLICTLLIPLTQIFFSYQIVFLLLALLYLISILTVPEVESTKNHWSYRLLLGYITPAVILVTVYTMLRLKLEYPFLTNNQQLLAGNGTKLTLIILAVIILCFIIIEARSLKNHHLFLQTLFRGFLMAFVLLYAPFFLGNFFAKNTALMLVYGIYLFGFEGGPILANAWKKLPFKQPSLAILTLAAGLVALVIPTYYTFILAIGCFAIHLGILNITLNDAHLKFGSLKKHQGIYVKYKLSNFGNQLFYLVFISFCIWLSYTGKYQITDFFMGKLTSNTIFTTGFPITATLSVLILLILGYQWQTSRHK